MIMGMARNGSCLFVTNMKGGVGKTACSTFLGMAVAHLGLSALIVDIDPTSNVSVRIPGMMPHITSGNTLLDILRGTAPEAYGVDMGFDLVPGDLNQDVKFKEIDRVSMLDETPGNIARVLGGWKRAYDLVIFDGSPRPSVGEMMLMKEADGIILPMTLDSASLIGVIFSLSKLYSVSQAEDQELPYFFLWPWGMTANKKNKPVIDDIMRMSEQHSCIVLPVFPKVGGLTDMLFDTADLEKLASRPEARLKRGDIQDMVHVVSDILEQLKQKRRIP